MKEKRMWQTGVSMPLYTVTDWLGLVPILICAGIIYLAILAVKGFLVFLLQAH